MDEESKNLWDQWIKEKDVKKMVWHAFKFYLTPMQEFIVRRIAFKEKKRISISAMTRYGKTRCVAIGIALLIYMAPKPTGIVFIGPRVEQAGLLRQYMAELIFKFPGLLGMAQISVVGEGRIIKEASRKRMTFSDGSEYRVFSAEGEADRLMGFGAGGVVVVDEACLISGVAWPKILRMLGDDPDNSVLIELYNPWERDNLAYEHSIDPSFEKIHVPWELAVIEGRTTKAFVMEQAKFYGGMDSLEFTVLYKSEFPTESEDSLFNLSHVLRAEKKSFGLIHDLSLLQEKLKNAHHYKEREIKEVKEEILKYRLIISCDPADKGLDETVIFWGVKKENLYEVVGFYSEKKSESMHLVGKIFRLCKEFIGKKTLGEVHIDNIGIGVGAFSRLKELVREHGYKNIRVRGCHFGESAIKKDHYINKKAENYFRLKSLFIEDMISIPTVQKLRQHLVAMKWELTSSSKKKIIDPSQDKTAKRTSNIKSPDWCFIAGTKILTTKGFKNIELVTVGDKVITPFGERKVLNFSSRIVNELFDCELSNGTHLIATGNHKIYTNETFKYLKDFSISDKLESSILKWRLKKLFNIKEENIGFQENIIMQTSTLGKEKRQGKRKDYIEQSGKINMIKRFLKGLKSIILMEIPLIIILKIWRLLNNLSIDQYTLKKSLKIIKNFILNSSKKPKTKPKNGINLKLELNGTKNIISIHSQKQNITKKDVLNAIKSMKQREKRNQTFVQKIVICDIIGLKDMVKKEFVDYVKRFLQRISILNQNIVHTNVLQFLGGIRVYSLEVDVDHVYYAENILVSNSDVLVYFVWKDSSELRFGFV